MNLFSKIKKVFSSKEPPPESTLFQWAGKSDVGKVRTNNEDFWLADPEIGLWIVCDGMGGHHGGEYASELAAQTILTKVQEGENLQQAILAAHDGVSQLGQHVENGKLPGTTVVALQITDNHYHLAWVGDSRCWLLQQDNLKQLSHDHTVVQQLVDWGDITTEEAQTHPDRNRLSQAIGQAGNPPVVGLVEGKVENDMTFLLATDGMTHWNDLSTLEKNLQQGGPEFISDQLIAASLAAGGFDNVTCVVVKIE